METLSLEQKLKAAPLKTIEVLTEKTKAVEQINKYIKEYKEIDRTQRATQIGQVQKNKIIKSNTVEAVRIPVHFQKKIVETSTAFEVGEAVTLLPNEKNGITDLISRLWRTSRMNSKIQKLKLLQKSETQAALQFYMKEIEAGSMTQRILAFFGIKNQKVEIKVNILENKNGKMTPYFDEYGDMTAFVWEFIQKNDDGKDIEHKWIYDNINCYKCSNSTGSFQYDETVKHGFDKIPIVYVSQDNPEWYVVQTAIDRIEVALSKLGASNDYSGHPMLIIEGTVENAPDKDEDGKAWVIPITLDDDKKEVKGDVRFLTNDNAPESVKLELEKLEDFIWSVSSTPNLSLNNLKELGADSGIAIRLKFLEPILKAKLNEGENTTMIERMVNIFISGIVTTTNVNLAKDAQNLFYDIQFNSILPDDLKTTVETLAAGVNAKIISQETAVKSLDLTDNSVDELSRIQLQTPDEEPPTD